MKTLALRIYLTVVAVLLVFALVSGWLAQRNFEHERSQVQSQAAWHERAAAWGELLENSLPPSTAPEDEQARVFLDWAERLRLPMALDNKEGKRIATSEVLVARLKQWPEMRDRLQQTPLSDGRVLWVVRPGLMRGHPMPGLMGPPPVRPDGEGPPPHGPPRARPWLEPIAWLMPPGAAHGVPALVVVLFLLFVAVALSAWPVAHRLTRRLQALRRGVEVFGSGQLGHRVAVEGRDEVATLAQSFNDAAQRIEDLVTSNRSLLANASHELRSPLARLKMAVSMMSELPPERISKLKAEIHQDIRELDSLVEEVLLASRLDSSQAIEQQPVDLLGLGTEEASRVNADVEAEPAFTQLAFSGDERLLRRAVRNLLENARRYGGPDVLLALKQAGQDIEVAVCDRGPGVPADQRERIFEPFYRMPGHAEHAGGVGLGLSLVRQIALRHGGTVRCEAREDGGSRFVLALPLKP
jgi:signal transduction histidine kinase